MRTIIYITIHRNRAKAHTEVYYLLCKAQSHFFYATAITPLLAYHVLHTVLSPYDFAALVVSIAILSSLSQA